MNNVVDRTKYDRTKAAVISIYKRPLPPPKASTQGAGQQSEAGRRRIWQWWRSARATRCGVRRWCGVTGCRCPGRPWRCRSPRQRRRFFPGKNHHDLPDGGVSSVADYVTAIQVNWQVGVDAFMSVARLCAEASARLTAVQKRELIRRCLSGTRLLANSSRSGPTPSVCARYSTPAAAALFDDVCRHVAHGRGAETGDCREGHLS